MSSSNHDVSDETCSKPEETGASHAGSAQSVRRPKNAFMLFSNDLRSIVQSQHPNVSNQEVSKLLGVIWRNLSEDQKGGYYQRAYDGRTQFRKEHPHYVFSRRKKVKKTAADANVPSAVISDLEAAIATVTKQADPGSGSGGSRTATSNISNKSNRHYVTTPATSAASTILHSSSPKSGNIVTKDGDSGSQATSLNSNRHYLQSTAMTTTSSISSSSSAASSSSILHSSSPNSTPRQLAPHRKSSNASAKSIRKTAAGDNDVSLFRSHSAAFVAPTPSERIDDSFSPRSLSSASYQFSPTLLRQADPSPSTSTSSSRRSYQFLPTALVKQADPLPRRFSSPYRQVSQQSFLDDANADMLLPFSSPPPPPTQSFNTTVEEEPLLSTSSSFRTVRVPASSSASSDSRSISALTNHPQSLLSPNLLQHSQYYSPPAPTEPTMTMERNIRSPPHKPHPPYPSVERNHRAHSEHSLDQPIKRDYIGLLPLFDTDHHRSIQTSPLVSRGRKRIHHHHDQSSASPYERRPTITLPSPSFSFDVSEESSPILFDERRKRKRTSHRRYTEPIADGISWSSPRHPYPDSERAHPFTAQTDERVCRSPDGLPYNSSSHTLFTEPIADTISWNSPRHHFPDSERAHRFTAQTDDSSRRTCAVTTHPRASGLVVGTKEDTWSLVHHLPFTPPQSGGVVRDPEEPYHNSEHCRPFADADVLETKSPRSEPRIPHPTSNSPWSTKASNLDPEVPDSERYRHRGPFTEAIVESGRWSPDPAEIITPRTYANSEHRNRPPFTDGMARNHRQSPYRHSPHNSARHNRSTRQPNEESYRDTERRHGIFTEPSVNPWSPKPYPDPTHRHRSRPDPILIPRSVQKHSSWSPNPHPYVGHHRRLFPSSPESERHAFDAPTNDRMPYHHGPGNPDGVDLFRHGRIATPTLEREDHHPSSLNFAPSPHHHHHHPTVPGVKKHMWIFNPLPDPIPNPNLSPHRNPNRSPHRNPNPTLNPHPNPNVNPHRNPNPTPNPHRNPNPNLIVDPNTRSFETAYTISPYETAQFPSPFTTFTPNDPSNWPRSPFAADLIPRPSRRQPSSYHNLSSPSVFSSTTPHTERRHTTDGSNEKEGNSSSPSPSSHVYRARSSSGTTRYYNDVVDFASQSSPTTNTVSASEPTTSYSSGTTRYCNEDVGHVVPQSSPTSNTVSAFEPTTSAFSHVRNSSGTTRHHNEDDVGHFAPSSSPSANTVSSRDPPPKPCLVSPEPNHHGTPALSEVTCPSFSSSKDPDPHLPFQSETES